MNLYIAPSHLVKKELNISLSDLFTLGYIIGMAKEQDTLNDDMSGSALVHVDLIVKTTCKNPRFTKGSIQRLITAKAIKQVYKDFEGNINYLLAPSSEYLEVSHAL